MPTHGSCGSARETNHVAIPANAIGDSAIAASPIAATRGAPRKPRAKDQAAPTPRDIHRDFGPGKPISIGSCSASHKERDDAGSRSRARPRMRARRGVPVCMNRGAPAQMDLGAHCGRRLGMHTGSAHSSTNNESVQHGAGPAALQVRRLAQVGNERRDDACPEGTRVAD